MHHAITFFMSGRLGAEMPAAAFDKPERRLQRQIAVEDQLITDADHVSPAITAILDGKLLGRGLYGKDGGLCIDVGGQRGRSPHDESRIGHWHEIRIGWIDQGGQ